MIVWDDLAAEAESMRIQDSVSGLASDALEEEKPLVRKGYRMTGTASAHAAILAYAVSLEMDVDPCQS